MSDETAIAALTDRRAVLRIGKLRGGPADTVRRHWPDAVTNDVILTGGRRARIPQDFYRIVRQRSANEMDAWLASAHRSGIPELRGFAEDIVRDYAAVKAALTLHWSNEAPSQPAPTPV